LRSKRVKRVVHDLFGLFVYVASVSSLACILLVTQIPPKYARKWYYVAIPLFFLEIVSFRMWNEPSRWLQATSIFISIIILCFCSLISLKLGLIMGLDKANARARKSVGRLKAFDPKAILSLTNKAVMLVGGMGIPTIPILLPFLPPVFALPCVTIIIVILIATMLWRFRSQTYGQAPDLRFEIDLRSLLVLFVLTLSAWFVVWIWYV
jgi:hypothetical protein